MDFMNFVNPIQQYLRLLGNGGNTPIHDATSDINNQLMNAGAAGNATSPYGIPHTTAEDAYTKFLSQIPQRPDHYSTMRKIGAVVAGMGAQDPMGAADQFLNAPYYNQMKDWQVQAPWMEKNADNERQANNLIRQQNYDNARINEYYAKTDETTRHNEAVEADRNRRTEIAAKRADIAAQVARGGVPRIDKNGRTFILYKDGTKIDVGIENFTPEEIEDMKKRNKMEEDAARIAEQGAQNRATKEVVSGTAKFNAANKTGAGGNISPTQHTAEENRLARQAISEHPEWAPYIIRDQNGHLVNTVLPAATSRGLFSAGSPGGDPRILQQVNDYIFKKGSTEKRVEVYDSKGNGFTVPESQLQEALKQGYTQKKGGV